MALLKERLTKSSQITKGIDLILNTFEQRLSRLEDTILPVYNETENLQKTQHSILFIAQACSTYFCYLFYDLSQEMNLTFVHFGTRGLGN